jgi:hypothetical protein
MSWHTKMGRLNFYEKLWGVKNRLLIHKFPKENVTTM